MLLKYLAVMDLAHGEVIQGLRRQTFGFSVFQCKNTILLNVTHLCWGTLGLTGLVVLIYSVLIAVCVACWFSLLGL